MILQILTSWTSPEEKIRAGFLIFILLLAMQAAISDYMWLVAISEDRTIGPYLQNFGYILSWMMAIACFALILRYCFKKFVAPSIDEEIEDEETIKNPDLEGFLDVSGCAIPQGPLTDAEKMQIMRETMGLDLHNGHQFWAIAEKNGRKDEKGSKDQKWATHCLTQKQKYKPI